MKSIRVNKDEVTVKNMIVNLISFVTLRKLKKVQNIRKILKEMKDQLIQEDDFIRFEIKNITLC